MGVRGTVPKRAAETLGHRKKEVTEAPSATKRIIPAPPAKESWHPTVKLWWSSLIHSGMVQFYEPSDWGMAAVFADALDREFDDEKILGVSKDGDVTRGRGPINPQTLAALLKLSTGLGFTEGDRRRMQIELTRNNDDEEREAEILHLVKNEEEEAFGA